MIADMLGSWSPKEQVDTNILDIKGISYHHFIELLSWCFDAYHKLQRKIENLVDLMSKSEPGSFDSSQVDLDGHDS